MIDQRTDTNDSSLQEIMNSIKDALMKGSLNNNGITLHLLDLICQGKYNVSQRDPEMIKKASILLSRQLTSRSKNSTKELGQEVGEEGQEEEEKERDLRQLMASSENEINSKKRSRGCLVPLALHEVETVKLIKQEESQIKGINPQIAVEISNHNQQNLPMQVFQLAGQMNILKREEEEIKQNMIFSLEKKVKIEENEQIKQQEYFPNQRIINFGIQNNHFVENANYQSFRVEPMPKKIIPVKQIIPQQGQNCIEQQLPFANQMTNFIKTPSISIPNWFQTKLEEPREQNFFQIQDSQQMTDSQPQKGASFLSNSSSFSKSFNKEVLEMIDNSTFQGQQEEKMREYKELENKKQKCQNDKKELQKTRQHQQQQLHWYKITLESIDEILQILADKIGLGNFPSQDQQYQQHPAETGKICNNVKIEQDQIEKQQENSSQFNNVSCNKLNTLQNNGPQRPLIDSQYWHQVKIQQDQPNLKPIIINIPKLPFPISQTTFPVTTPKSICHQILADIDEAYLKWGSKLKQFIETEHLQQNESEQTDLMTIIQRGIFNSRIDRESNAILSSQHHGLISKELNLSIQKELNIFKNELLQKQQDADLKLQELIRVNFWPKKYKYTREKGPKHKQQEIEEEIIQNKLLQQHNKQLLIQITEKKFQTLKGDQQSKREYIKLENYLIKRHQDERKLSKKLQLHNQMKNFIMYAIRYIADKVQYPDPHEIESHKAILKSFHLSYNKSDLQALTTPYEPYTLEHIEKVLALAGQPKEQFKHNKHFLFQKEMIMKYNPNLYKTSIQNIKIEADSRDNDNKQICDQNDTIIDSKPSNILNDGEVQKEFDLETLTWEDLYNNPWVLEIFNKEVLRIKKFNEQNRILMQAFCLFEYSKIILTGKGNKIDHLYGNQFILSALRFPEIIQL